MSPYPLIHKRNLPAYLAVMAAWIVVAVLSAAVLRWLANGGIAWGLALIWALVTCMAGMGIMFGASVLNLRKLGPGFARLAAGAEDPRIPPVWCPVLTAATNAALTLNATLRQGDASKTLEL